MSALAAIIAARISQTGPLPYAEFIDAALYEPDLGFYETGGHAGRRGDFLTSPEIGPLFGTVMGRALDSWWVELGCPGEFCVYELGAGPGTLARAVLASRDALRCGEALHYVTVERSAAQRASHPHGVEARASLEAGRLSGVVLANELLDNVAFDLEEVRAQQWHEVRVGFDGKAFVEELGPSADAAPGLADGVRRPRQRAAASLVADVLDRLSRGQLVVIDYMAHAADFIARDWRSWVRTFAGHERGVHPLENPGDQDVTCDVDLDALQGVATPAEISNQADFLRGHGLDELVAEGRALWQANAGVGNLAALRARSRVREAEALCDPDGLGGFTVMRWVR